MDSSPKVGKWWSLKGHTSVWVTDNNVPVTDRVSWAKLHRQFPQFRQMVIAHGYQHAWRYKTTKPEGWDWIFRWEEKDE